MCVSGETKFAKADKSLVLEELVSVGSYTGSNIESKSSDPKEFPVASESRYGTVSERCKKHH